MEDASFVALTIMSGPDDELADRLGAALGDLRLATSLLNLAVALMLVDD